MGTIIYICAADVLGCGKPYASTDGTLVFGECMADLSLEMPIHTKDLNYNERVIKLAGKKKVGKDCSIY